ncbi:hypothetical protein ACLESO_60135, partial [Pyxidicoccus sp. 3LG]
MSSLDVVLALAENLDMASAEGSGGAGACPASRAARGRGAQRFATSFTGPGARGEDRPHLRRHREIRQMVDILSRRRKN